MVSLRAIFVEFLWRPFTTNCDTPRRRLIITEVISVKQTPRATSCHPPGVVMRGKRCAADCRVIPMGAVPAGSGVEMRTPAIIVNPAALFGGAVPDQRANTRWRYGSP